MKKNYIIPIFVPHKGCPHDCIFCNQKKITGISTDVTREDVENIISTYLETINHDSNIEVAFFGGSFTAIDIKIQESLLSAAKHYLDKKIINDIRISTRPDCIDDEILVFLKKYGVSIIELGVQSLDEEVLRLSERGHTAIHVKDAVNLIRKYDFKLGLQMMVGLLGDTEEKSIDTARKIIDLRPDFTRIYPVLVVRETGLEYLFKQNKFNSLSIEETTEIVKKLLVLFYLNNIGVIRVGLQPSDDIAIGKEVISGPYHPALREIIEAKMIGDYIEHLVKVNNIKKEISIYSEKKYISKIIGNRKSNVIYFKDEFNISLCVQEKENHQKITISWEECDISISMDDLYSKLNDLYFGRSVL